MFIAHLPAGYLLGKGLKAARLKAAMSAALMGSLFPDLDLFYFYLIDNRQHNHHSYWIHYPIVWLSLLLLSGVWLLCSRRAIAALWVFVFSLSGVMHIVLDLMVGDIKLLAPFSHEYYVLLPVKIERVYEPWWLNFILHWSFLLELAIVVAAIVVFAKSRKKAIK